VNWHTLSLTISEAVGLHYPGESPQSLENTKHRARRGGLATTPKTRTESRRQLDGKPLACSELVFKTISHELSDLQLVGNNRVKYMF
jgi:hypothetical protein